MTSRRWDFISAHVGEFGVQRLCRVLRLSRSGYYRWLAGADARAARQAADDALVAEIREIHTEVDGPGEGAAADSEELGEQASGAEFAQVECCSRPCSRASPIFLGQSVDQFVQRP